MTRVGVLARIQVDGPRRDRDGGSADAGSSCAITLVPGRRPGGLGALGRNMPSREACAGGLPGEPWAGFGDFEGPALRSPLLAGLCDGRASRSPPWTPDLRRSSSVRSPRPVGRSSRRRHPPDGRQRPALVPEINADHLGLLARQSVSGALRRDEPELHRDAGRVGADAIHRAVGVRRCACPSGRRVRGRATRGERRGTSRTTSTPRRQRGGQARRSPRRNPRDSPAARTGGSDRPRTSSSPPAASG